MKKMLALMALPLALSVAACQSKIGANDYSTNATGEVNRALKCKVVSVRNVQVATENGVGTAVGGIAGGVAGSMIGGSDTAHILGAVGGAVLGGIAGNAAQGALTNQGGYEYIVEVDGGRLVTVTQGSDVLLTPGQQCMVLYGKQARVVPYQ